MATPVAGLDPPTIDINGSSVDLGALGCAPRGAEVACSGENLAGNGYRLDSWSFVLNPDPSITSNIVLTNLSTATQTFTLTITLPVAPTGPELSATGSVGAGTLTDLNANDATLTDAGTAIYQALIDGSPVRTLLDPPQSFTALANPFGAPSSVPIPAASFGPDLLVQPANASIGMRLHFTLTGGDQVALPLTFDVKPVPEPGTFALLGCGLAGLVRARRRNL